MQVIVPAEAADLINQLRASGTVLAYDPDTHTLRSGDSGMITVTAGQNHDSTRTATSAGAASSNAQAQQASSASETRPMIAVVTKKRYWQPPRRDQRLVWASSRGRGFWSWCPAT